MNWYIKALKQYADFSGRARRSEFWFFTLFNVIFAVVAMFLDNILGTTFDIGLGFSMPYGYVYILYLLAMMIPGLSVAVRRLHDVGKSGWMYLVILIPLIGLIWLLVLFFTDSQPGSNQWGNNPKEVSA